MTTQQLEATGFTINGKTINSTTYRDYLSDYGSDETTSPRGVAPRLHIREVEEEYQIWSWGVGGNHPRYDGQTFDSKEEAELYLFECAEWYINEKTGMPRDSMTLMKMRCRTWPMALIEILRLLKDTCLLLLFTKKNNMNTGNS